MLERFFPNADLAFGVLGTELWSPAGLALAAKAVRRLGRAGALAFLGEVLQSSRDWLETTFASERAHGVLAPWVLHTGLGPDQATSGFMTQVIAVAVQEGGMPVPRGGGAKLADALVQLIRDHGGVCETDRDVERVLVRSGRAVGVRLTDGETIEAERAVVASVTPTQLYERLLADADVPAPVADGARRFRYGRSEMQIHYALSEPPRWDGDERLGGNGDRPPHARASTASRAPSTRPSAGCSRPRRRSSSASRSRSTRRARPTGRGLLWIQLQELPWRIKGDAAGELDTGDGEWTDELRERYADRIQARLARHIPNLESSILKRVALGPHDLQRGERQPPPRRPLRRLARARPELPLAAVRGAAPGTRRRSSGSGRSARAPGPAPASAPARGRSSRGSCSSRRSRSAPWRAPAPLAGRWA